MSRGYPIPSGPRRVHPIGFDVQVPPEAYDKKQWSTEYAYSSRRAVQMNAVQPPQVIASSGIKVFEDD